MDNKDYIINIRVSKETYTKIRDRAHENRETVSQLVRKVIHDSTEIINDITDDCFGKESIKKNIVTYDTVTAAQDIRCAHCSKTIHAGETIVVGETANGKKHYFCVSCHVPQP